jgi:ankyrin repeat protein
MEQKIFELIKKCTAPSWKEAKELLELHFDTIDINCRCYYGSTTLFCIACERDSIEIVQLLLKHPLVDVNYSSNNTTALQSACYNGRSRIVELLLHDKRINVDRRGINQGTLLHTACIRNQTKIVGLLLNDKRIDPCAMDAYNDTPLHDACQNNSHEVVRLLSIHNLFHQNCC